MLLRADPMSTCTPSIPIFFATSKHDGSAFPSDHSHAPILNQRFSAAANSGANCELRARTAVVLVAWESISRRGNWVCIVLIGLPCFSIEDLSEGGVTSKTPPHPPDPAESCRRRCCPASRRVFADAAKQCSTRESTAAGRKIL